MTKLADAVRRDVIETALDRIRGPSEPSGQPVDVAGVFSAVDLLSVLYTEFLRHRPDHPSWPDRDRLIVANAGLWPALGAILFRLGYFEDESLRRGPWSMSEAPGVDFSARSRESGFGAGVGMALALRDDGRSSRVVVVLDGVDLDSGRTWESVATASSERLSGLCVVIDHRRGSGPPDRGSVMPEAEAAARFKAFGWDSHVFDGHSPDEIRYALTKFGKSAGNRPCAMVARTRRGGGSKVLEAATEQTAQVLEAAMMELDTKKR